jgi:hypothetical protein
VAAPAGRPFEKEHGEPPADEAHRRSQRRERQFHHVIAEELDVGHLVVVEGNEVTREEFPVGVEGEPDGADRYVDPAQRRCWRERRPVEDAVNKSHGHEEPCDAVKRAPALIAAE